MSNTWRPMDYRQRVRKLFLACGSIMAAIAVIYCLNKTAVLEADNGGQLSGWANPTAMVAKKVSVTTSAQNEPNFLDNLDCGLVTYRPVADNAMRTGCFIDTAFGMMDSDTSTVIFNGTDEGLPLLPFSNEILAPWPGTENLLALNPIGGGSAYLGLYKNALSVMRDQRDYLLRLSAKRINVPPETALTDPSGQRLVINPQTLAFSDGGYWAVAETLNGSFVRINLATLDVIPFAPSYSHPGSPALLKSTVTISRDGRFAAIANDDDISLKVFDLSTCTGPVNNLQPMTCQFFNYRPYLKTQISSLQSIRHLRFINEEILSLEVRLNNGDNGGIYELSPAADLDSLTNYIGLGDSYTSGEGAFDYIAETDDSSSNMCHLSARSYPLLLTHDLFGNSGGHSVACSGAVINDVGNKSDSYHGQVRGVPSFSQLKQDQPALLNSVMTNFVPGYIAQQRFVSLYQPKIVTLSVGGDDIGFGDLVENCVEPHLSRHLSDDVCFNTYEARLELKKLVDRSLPKWTKLYKQLLAESPNTRLYATGYPQIVSDKGSCGLNVHLSQSELEFAIEIVSYLNDAINQAAEKAGAYYVDISQALAGHRLCETASYNIAMNGLTAGRDGGIFGLKVFGKESYHPNALGQALIEQAILQKTHNLTTHTPGQSLADHTKLLTAPTTGRQVVARVPVKSITPKIVKKSLATTLKVNGSQTGGKAKTAYTVRIDGPTGRIIGSLNSDDNGDIDGQVIVPSDIGTGGHSIDLIGENQAGEQSDVTQPIYVPETDTDADGDGKEDNADSCPGAFNSGQDSDLDGIDDVCDALIGQPSDKNSLSGGQQVALGSGTAVSGSVRASTAIWRGRKNEPSHGEYTEGTQQVHSVYTRPQVVKNSKLAKTLNRPKKAKLFVLNWLLWFGLPVIVWWVILLVAAFRRRRGREAG